MFKHMGSNTYHFSTFYFCFPNLQDCPVSILGSITAPWFQKQGPVLSCYRSSWFLSEYL